MTIDAACAFLASAQTNVVLGERVAGATSLPELVGVARDEGFEVSTTDLRLLCTRSESHSVRGSCERRRRGAGWLMRGDVGQAVVGLVEVASS